MGSIRQIKGVKKMKNISVLIIEDSVYSADLNVRELKKAGYAVAFKIVSSETSMKEAFNESKYDLILSDNSMPNFNALKALEVRNDEDSNIPFIIVSEDMSKSDIEKAFQEGCSAFVAKETLAELRNIVIDVFKNPLAGIRIGI